LYHLVRGKSSRNSEARRRGGRILSFPAGIEEKREKKKYDLFTYEGKEKDRPTILPSFHREEPEKRSLSSRGGKREAPPILNLNEGASRGGLIGSTKCTTGGSRFNVWRRQRRRGGGKEPCEPHASAPRRKEMRHRSSDM